MSDMTDTEKTIRVIAAAAMGLNVWSLGSDIDEMFPDMVMHDPTWDSFCTKIVSAFEIDPRRTDFAVVYDFDEFLEEMQQHIKRRNQRTVTVTG